jgi:hypothetical protein
MGPKRLLVKWYYQLTSAPSYGSPASRRRGSIDLGKDPHLARGRDFPRIRATSRVAWRVLYVVAEVAR